MRALPLLLEDAIALAVSSHRGQRDLEGRPYILHPLRVMASFTDPEDDEARIAAVLHDIVEDTDMTPAQLLNEGYPQVCVDAIIALSRREGEEYAEYIERVAANPLARRVKLADLQDNLDLTRKSTQMLPWAQRKRYLDALNCLVEVAQPAT